MAVGDFRCAISLNIKATKTAAPFVEPSIVYEMLRREPATPFMDAYANCLARMECGSALPEDNAALTQGMHMQLIEARMRILYLEEKLSTLLEIERRGMAHGPDNPGTA